MGKDGEHRSDCWKITCSTKLFRQELDVFLARRGFLRDEDAVGIVRETRGIEGPGGNVLDGRVTKETKKG